MMLHIERSLLLVIFYTLKYGEFITYTDAQNQTVKIQTKVSGES